MLTCHKSTSLNLYILFTKIACLWALSSNTEKLVLNTSFRNLFVEVGGETLVEVLHPYNADEKLHQFDAEESFFRNFPRIMYKTYCELENVENCHGNEIYIFNYAALLNKKYNNGSGTNHFEIWASMLPDTMNSLDELLNVIYSANAISPGTVTTILLRCDFDAMRFPKLIVEVAQNCTRSHKQISKTLSRQAGHKIKVGIVFRTDNCLQNGSLTNHLKMENLQYLILRPSPFLRHTRSKAGILKNIDNFETCKQTLKNFVDGSLTKVGFRLDSNIQYDFTTRQINPCSNCGFDEYTEFNKEKDGNVILSMHIPTRPTDQVLEAKRKNITKTWTNTEKPLNKRRIGFQIYFDSKIFNSTKLIKTILSNSPNLVVENAYKLENQSENLLLEFMTSLVRIKKELYEHSSTKDFTKERFVPIKVILRLNIFETEDFLDYKHWTNVAVSTAGKTNRLSPGTVDSVAIYLEKDALNLNTYNELFSTVKLEASDEQETWPRFGAALDMNICPNLTTLEPYNHTDIDLILFVYNILNFNSQYHELDEANRIETLKWYQTCESALGVLKSKQNYAGKGLYYTTTNGCNLRSSDPYQVYKQAVFVDMISNMAGTLKSTMFINPAFVPAWDANTSALSRPVFQEGEYYDCGWWQVSLGNDSNGDYIFENKFELTRKIYGHLKELPEDILFPKNEPVDSFPWWLIVLSVAAIFVVTTVLFALLVVRYRSKYILRKRELEEFFNGGDSTLDDVAANGSDIAARLKYNKELYEVSPSSFTIDETCFLGSGAFGIVYAGVIEANGEKMQVAVKLTKASDTTSVDDAVIGLRGLISEIKILSYIGRHEHIVCLHGAYTAKLRTGYVLVFLEYCELGSLEKYLRSVQTEQSNEVNLQADGKTRRVTLGPEFFDQLYKWCKEIANGMEYISSKHIVHADLATRNILLTSNKTAKIADFGLSRRVYDYTSYVKKQQEPLPWRWMAPESLKRMEFSSKSDVWSYGITLWEIYSLGDVPYPGAVWDKNFLENLEAERMPEKPKYDGKGLYEKVMQQCWKLNPDRRPSFVQIKQVFEKSVYDIVI